MIFVAIIVLCILLNFISYGLFISRKEETNHNDSRIVFDISCIVTVVFLIIGLGHTGKVWVAQASDIENVVKFENIEAIYKAKADALTSEFARYLADTYPEHEKDIYDKISPEKVDLYFAKYPELRSSDTLVVLVNRINQLQSDVYEQQVLKEEALKGIRFRLRHPFVLTFLLPEK